MDPIKDKSSIVKSPKILFILCMIFFFIIVVAFYVSENGKDMAPGIKEAEDDVIIIANDEHDVDMPSPVVGQTESQTMGTLETVNGTYDIIGL